MKVIPPIKKDQLMLDWKRPVKNLVDLFKAKTSHYLDLATSSFKKDTQKNQYKEPYNPEVYETKPQNIGYPELKQDYEQQQAIRHDYKVAEYSYDHLYKAQEELIKSQTWQDTAPQVEPHIIEEISDAVNSSMYNAPTQSDISDIINSDQFDAMNIKHAIDSVKNQYDLTPDQAMQFLIEDISYRLNTPSIIDNQMIVGLEDNIQNTQFNQQFGLAAIGPWHNEPMMGPAGPAQMQNR